ncbi:hypothetical protein AM500_18080 [Bacillus sp. FJAT-18017]|uniref:hypothetical protein n=1 Tax=Bacillus sp. FJAT-18017 TaxID=1705566 RepID=UPI0006ADDE73|nr:hypothetical protein [Bacillus sp. FJAT-18017]ALC91484.1 hypothetical protein AM500_18080 [Bacillus sp. FJAT-18017]
MKKKLIWIPLLAALLSMVVLYAIGNVFEISLLSWDFYQENSSEGFAFEAGGSFLPIIIGVIIGFITERILKNRHKSNANLV